MRQQDGGGHQTSEVCLTSNFKGTKQCIYSQFCLGESLKTRGNLLERVHTLEHPLRDVRHLIPQHLARAGRASQQRPWSVFQALFIQS